MTTWGHVKASPGLWALSPFTLAADDRVRAQADMKALGRPGVGEEILADAGFVDVRRHSVPFAWEFPDPETLARALAATGPAYEAIREVGAEEFHRHCVEVATQQVRAGLPLRAEIACVGFTAQAARRPVTVLLGEPDTSPGASALAEEDVADLGFVANATKLWMHDPAAFDELRAACFDHGQILRLTLFITLRIAFATVNGALGARPEQEYVDLVDPVVRAAWEAALRS